MEELRDVESKNPGMAPGEIHGDAETAMGAKALATRVGLWGKRALDRRESGFYQGVLNDSVTKRQSRDEPGLGLTNPEGAGWPWAPAITLDLVCERHASDLYIEEEGGDVRRGVLAARRETGQTQDV